MAETIRYAQGDSSLGGIVAAISARGLALLAFADGRDDLLEGLRTRFPEADLVEDAAALQEALARLARLIEHPDTRLDLPLDLRGTEFERRVWNALREIPPGQTVSYGDVAVRIGSPREAREVAEACAGNMLAVVVPCHRVVKKDGRISGYRWGVKRRRALIAREQQATHRLAG